MSTMDPGKTEAGGPSCNGLRRRIAGHGDADVNITVGRGPGGGSFGMSMYVGGVTGAGWPMTSMDGNGYFDVVVETAAGV